MIKWHRTGDKKNNTFNFCKTTRFINAAKGCTRQPKAEHLGRRQDTAMAWIFFFFCQDVTSNRIASASERRPTTSRCTNTEISNVTPFKTTKRPFPQPLSTIIAGHIPMDIRENKSRRCHGFQRRSTTHFYLRMITNKTSHMYQRTDRIWRGSLPSRRCRRAYTCSAKTSHR